jgi:hypothetical protein
MFTKPAGFLQQQTDTDQKQKTASKSVTTTMHSDSTVTNNSGLSTPAPAALPSISNEEEKTESQTNADDAEAEGATSSALFENPFTPQVQRVERDYELDRIRRQTLRLAQPGVYQTEIVWDHPIINRTSELANQLTEVTNALAPDTTSYLGTLWEDHKEVLFANTVTPNLPTPIEFILFLQNELTDVYQRTGEVTKVEDQLFKYTWKSFNDFEFAKRFMEFKALATR